MSSAILFTHSGKDVSSETALSLCTDVLVNNSAVEFVFFYFNTVNILAESEMHSAWLAIKQRYGLNLVTCSTAANKRQLSEDNAGPFELAGLSEFYSRLHTCNTVIQL